MSDLIDDIGWVLWSGTIGLDSPIQSRVEAARAAGFSQVSLGPLDVAQLEAEGIAPAELGRSLRKAGLDIVMDPVMGWYGGGPLPGRFAAFDLEQFLRMSEALQVVSMTAIGPFRAGEVAFGKLVESFAILCDRAADLGARVPLEFMPITAITDVASAWAIVDGAGRANGGLVVDTWHFFRGTPDLSALERVPGDRIFAVQVADAAREVRGSLAEETFNRMLPGDGELDLAGLLRALDRVGGLRWVGPEVISPVTAAMPPADAARIAGSRVRDLITGIRSETRPARPTRESAEQRGEAERSKG